MAEVDVAWAAGLFEGEGSICLTRSGKHPQLRLLLNMSDEDVVRRFADVVGVPNVTGPYERPGRPDDKPMWHWTSSAKADVLRIIEEFMPYLGERRAAHALECIEKRWGLDTNCLAKRRRALTWPRTTS